MKSSQVIDYMVHQKKSKSKNYFLWSNKCLATRPEYYVLERENKQQKTSWSELPTSFLGLLAIINFAKAINYGNFFP